MKIKSFTYEVRGEVAFTGQELMALQELSARHYDGVCKAAGKVGGFLYGFINQWGLLTDQFDVEEPDLSKEAEITCKFRDLDTLAKIAEAENLYRMIGNMPVKGNFGLQLSQMLRAMNNESRKVNNIPER
jgi:hypothetical protein